jgi:ketosteroid isomerase-like protein
MTEVARRARMNEARLSELAERFIAAWNSQDVEQVVACYTPDVTYWEPGARGEGVRNEDGMRRYLRKLFATWKMHWSLREVHPFQSGQGAAVLWRATLRRAEGGASVEVKGMDLVVLEGERIKRNEVYFDRVALASLIGA